MKILLMTESPSITGGWATYARNVEAALKNRDLSVTLMSPEHPEPLRSFPSPFDLIRHPIRFLGMQSALRTLSPEIMHITAEPFALLFAFLPKAILRRCVLTIHGSYGVRLLRSPLTRFLLKRIFREFPAFVAVSAYTKERMAEEIAVRLSPDLARRFLERSHVIYNAVRPSPAGGRVGDGGVHGKPRQILLVGPVKPRKGILEAIEACARYRDTYGAPFVLRIIGTIDDDPYVRAVKERITALRLEDSIRFEGVLSPGKLEEAYRAADLLLLPARTTDTTFEGFGLVYIEAAARGVPCIGPEESGAAEAIDEGRSGYHVRPDDAAGIAERMHRILDERRIAPRECRAWAEKFSLERLGAALESAYAAALEHAPGA